MYARETFLLLSIILEVLSPNLYTCCWVSNEKHAMLQRQHKSVSQDNLDNTTASFSQNEEPSNRPEEATE